MYSPKISQSYPGASSNYKFSKPTYNIMLMLQHKVCLSNKSLSDLYPAVALDVAHINVDAQLKLTTLLCTDRSLVSRSSNIQTGTCDKLN